MSISRKSLLLIISAFLIILMPQKALLPIRNGTLLAFCPSSPPKADEEPIRIWALEEENQALHVEIHHLREALGLAEADPLRLKLTAAIPAKVIYKGPSTWNSTLWIGVGEADNKRHSQIIIAKGSPAVVGNKLVGVVDYVGKHRSRVALITDSHLHPSVEVASKERKVKSLYNHISLIAEVCGESFLEENCPILHNRLGKNQLDESPSIKGELQGSMHTLWRSRKKVLKGVGFEGGALTKQGDLLITTGLDGVFPAGLEAAYVMEVTKASKAVPSYELKALPAVGELEGIRYLFVLSPEQ